MIVLAWAKGSVLLWYKEEGGGLGGLRGYDPSCLKMFFNKGSTRLHLHWVERVNFGNFGGEVWAKFNGVVIRAMRRELIMGFLGEDISKVLAPIRYNWFSQLGGLSDLGGDGGFVD